MTNAEILIKARRGKSALKERQKSITKEHTERCKKLEALMDQIDKAELSGQLQLAGTSRIDLAPEIKDLLENPLHGL